jgi:hypothetical protein
MVPHNNGTLPPSHIALREANRRQRKADLHLLSTPPRPLEAGLRPFIHWAIFWSIILVALFLYLLWGSPRVAGAAARTAPAPQAWSQVEAKRPDPSLIRIVGVRALDEGMYAVELANGDKLLVSPQTTKTPAPKVGPARKPHNLLLIQGTARFTIGAIIYYEDQR